MYLQQHIVFLLWTFLQMSYCLRKFLTVYRLIMWSKCAKCPLLVRFWPNWAFDTIFDHMPLYWLSCQLCANPFSIESVIQLGFVIVIPHCIAYLCFFPPGIPITKCVHRFLSSFYKFQKWYELFAVSLADESEIGTVPEQNKCLHYHQ